MKKINIRTTAIVLTLAILTSVLASCGSSATPANSASSTAASTSAVSSEPAAPKTPAYKELTVYTALPESEIPYYFNAFEKDTGVKVNYVRLSSGEMLSRVTAEAANPNASLMFGGSSENYIAANELGLLEAYQPSDLSNVSAEYLDPNGVWVPFYVGALSFACNKDWFAKKGLELPKTWDDLLKPEFKDQISIAHPTTSGTSYTVLASIVQKMGEEKTWEYLKKLDANVRQYTKAGSAPPMEVALGEAAIAITFAHDGLKPAMEGYPIEVVFPEDGTGYEIGAMALIKNANPKELDNAKAFMDWAISVRGQECFIESKSNRLPINIKAKVSEGLKPISEINIIEYDAVWSGENRARLLEEFTAKVDNAEGLKQ